MRCLVPIRDDEREFPNVEWVGSDAYWRRLVDGVVCEIDGRPESFQIGAVCRHNLIIPSIVEYAQTGTSDELRLQAARAVPILEACEGIVVVCRSNAPERLEEAMDELDGDLRRVGRTRQQLPIVLQATFQDVAGVLSPAALGKTVGIRPHLCVASVANKCIGVREALSLLLQEIRSRTGEAST